jgi:large subunit ribosomal protein L6
MSRIGQQPVPIPKGVEITVTADNVVTCRGPGKGVELVQRMHPEIAVEVGDDEVIVTRPSDQKRHKALHGLTRSLIANMVTGVVDGYQKQLEVFGMGYRAEVQGKELVLQLGYSHPCRVSIPEGIEAEVEGNKISVRGADKMLVGQVAANIKKLRKISVYRPRGQDLRGIRYVGEHTRFKAGKAGKVGA